MSCKKRVSWIGMVVSTFALASFLPATGQSSEGKDPTRETVLIGVREAGGMSIKFEIEPAEPMFMSMHGMWMESGLQAGEIHHFEVKPEDPGSKTRISYAAVKLRALNKSTGKTIEKELHPMWGGTGLHYGANGALPGDGDYIVTIIVEPPTFARGPKNQNLWRKPAQAEFRFKLKKGRIVP